MTGCFCSKIRGKKIISILIPKQITAAILHSQKVNKLQLEMENMNKQHKEAVDIYQKDIETKKVNENKLHEEVRGVNFYCNFTFF